ncbi:hypothetical protein LEP1GSC061_0555 [Leptospira wolffii serovar Khorat str. Khorat-H2]|nr:hypothetical protein LEP1GSC061_0555 [Leptospira wolffii serovar Khorat str. Khorat-H2]
MKLFLYKWESKKAGKRTDSFLFFRVEGTTTWIFTDLFGLLRVLRAPILVLRCKEIEIRL